MSPQPRYPSVSSKEVRALLRKADRLVAQANELGSVARAAIRAAFLADDDQPTPEDRERRAQMVKKGKRKP